MAIIDDIIVWAENLPIWQGDAIRRMLVAGNLPLNAQDEEEITAFAKAEWGLASLPKNIEPLRPSAGMFSGTPIKAEAVQLMSIDDVKNVNIIEPGKTLPFAESGITVVYGSNGSGKSGYARILKLACSARHKDERIYQNVFKPATNVMPSATFKLKINGETEPTKIYWNQGKSTDDILTNIIVFDAHCARLITDKGSEITYLPYGADIFEKLVALISRVKAAIDTGIITLKALQDSGVIEGTSADLFLRSLSENIKDEDIKIATHWTEEDESKLVAQENLLRASDNTKANEEILRLNKIKNRLTAADIAVSQLLISCNTLNNSVCEQVLAELYATRQAYQETLLERKIEDPLPGVSSTNQWEILYNAAKRYSEEIAYLGKSFPNTMENSLCVLCQQPLNEEASIRFVRFKKFMEDATSKLLEAKRASLKSLRDKFETLAPWRGDMLDCICDELLNFNADAASMTRAFHESIVLRKFSALEILKEGEDPGKLGLSNITDSPQSQIQAVVKLITQKVEDITKSSNPEEFKKLQSEVFQLKSRKALNLRITDINNYIAQARKNAAIRSATASIRTQEITRQGTSLIRKNVTPDLLENFQKELVALSGERLLAPISVRPIGAGGETQHEILLEGANLPTRAKISNILSEGEARIVAIAGFLAELNLSKKSNTIVFDDPVSSLDHVFTAKIAARIASEGLNRQVIIFTHSIAFLMELQDAVDVLRKGEQSLVFQVQTLRRNKEFSGITANGMPWQGMKIKERAHHLEQEVAKISGCGRFLSMKTAVFSG